MTRPQGAPTLSYAMEPPSREDIVARAQPKLARLLKLVEGKQTLLAQTHDFPDPDTIASAMGLGWLLGELCGLDATIGYGGIIGRAENKAMIKQLGIKMKRTSLKDFEKYDLVALLDTQPEVGNHCVPNSLTPNIVFDHHFPRELEGPTPEFHDVGGQYGATSTKVTELIIAAGIEPPTDVATALFYGVKSDTQNLAREASPADIAAYLYLLPRADNRVLNEIENPQVPLDYFRVLNKAILRAKLYDSMIVSDLGEVYTPDLCAEVADRLLQVEGVKHALAVGWYEESLFLSMRTRSRKQNAGKILHSIVVGLKLGTAGGHGPMAGARIPLEGRSQRARADIRRKVVNRVLRAFNQDYRHFSRIVSKKDTGTAIDPPPPKGEEHPKRPVAKKTETKKVESKKNGVSEAKKPEYDDVDTDPAKQDLLKRLELKKNGHSHDKAVRKPKPSKKKAAVTARASESESSTQAEPSAP